MMETATNTSNSSTYFEVSMETKIIWSAVLILVCVLTVVFNLATILTFVINRHLRRRSMYCLINLAVVDMLFGAFHIAYQSFFVAGSFLGRTYSKILWTFVFLTLPLVFVTSLFSLVLVSLERVYATFFPFRHRTMRLTMYIVAFTMTWLLSLFLVISLHLLPGSSKKMILIFIFVAFLSCIITICTAYTAIFVKVKIQAKRLQLNQQHQTAAIRQKREQHLAMTLFIASGLTLIAWLPYTITMILQTLTSHIFPSEVGWMTLLIHQTNSVINPIIYVFRMRDFRKALSQLIFKCSRDQQQVYLFVPHGNHGTQQQPPIELQAM